MILTKFKYQAVLLTKMSKMIFDENKFSVIDKETDLKRVFRKKRLFLKHKIYIFFEKRKIFCKAF